MIGLNRPILAGGNGPLFRGRCTLQCLSPYPGSSRGRPSLRTLKVRKVYRWPTSIACGTRAGVWECAELLQGGAVDRSGGRLTSFRSCSPSICASGLERGDGGADRREEAVGADLGGEAGLREDLALAALEAGEAERDVALPSSCVQLSQHVDRRRVEERPCLGVEHEPVEVVGRVGQVEHAPAEVLGVDEEGRCVEAVDEQPGDGLGAVKRSMSW